MPEVTGEIAAEFAHIGGRTQLCRRFHASPLKIAKTFRFGPFQPGTDLLGVYMMDCSPGLMSGDRYSLDVKLGQRSGVFLTNQSFTKVHPSRGVPARQKQFFRIDKDALLEYIPEPVMLYEGAWFLGETEVSIEPGGTFMLSDIVCPGRSERGEQFRYEAYSSRMKVRYGDELVFYNHLKIEPQRSALPAPGCWENQTHLGAFYVFSDRIAPVHVELLRASLAAAAESLGRRNGTAADVRVGVSMTYKHGLAVSLMGNRAWHLQSYIAQAWNTMREALFGLPPLDVKK